MRRRILAAGAACLVAAMPQGQATAQALDLRDGTWRG